MSTAELASELTKRKDQLFKLGFGRTASVEKNPLIERILRREVAMIHTWIHEKGVEAK